jgi:hypothetical protein
MNAPFGRVGGVVSCVHLRSLQTPTTRCFRFHARLCNPSHDAASMRAFAIICCASSRPAAVLSLSAARQQYVWIVGKADEPVARSKRRC